MSNPAAASGIPHTIPEGARRPGQPVRFDPETYNGRNVVERCVHRLKQWRSVATRFENRPKSRAIATIAALMISLAGAVTLRQRTWAASRGL